MTDARDYPDVLEALHVERTSCLRANELHAERDQETLPPSAELCEAIRDHLVAIAAVQDRMDQHPDIDPDQRAVFDELARSTAAVHAAEAAALQAIGSG